MTFPAAPPGSRRPTRRGWGLLAAAAVLCGGGLGLGYLGPAVLGGLALPAFAAAVLLARPPGPVRVRRRVTATRVRAGEPVTVTLDLPPVRAAAAEHLTGPDGTAAFSLGTARRLRYEVTPGRRGVLEAGPLTLVRTDPLGLVRAARRADDAPVRILVHPRHHELAPAPAAGAGGRDTAAAVTRAADGAFAGLREHAPGDDVRRVHWRTSARRGRLMVREHADSPRPELTVLVDDRHGPAELDALAEVAASIVRTAPAELRLAGGGRATGGTVAHLDLLAEAAPRPGADFAGACAALRGGPPGRAIVLLSGRAAADAGIALAALAGRRAVSLVAVIGDGPLTAPPSAQVKVLQAADPAEFAERWNRFPRWPGDGT
ncbi:DUF58 domain-containing protein [Actinomadura algeriensis]|uniref:Uncharacterized protein (DUF58 family) n=1 Tax=Actinomadura algeriensis TaxID=1679523 RepID=A0ABR9JNW2_9ACTN|nr:DUF58 domain-containing protein [Actinomadura algeriensis]MBE1532098.1 uncharacterized protein (DUF58 family) [Actinomadura algeriensis]